MKTSRENLSIIVPCFNEEGNVKALFERIKSSLPNEDFQVVFVNDGSFDNTENEIRKLLNDYQEFVVLISKKENEGIASAWMSGLAAAKMDLVCFLDADLQNPPEYIPIMRQNLLDQNFDVVQGTRSDLDRIRDHRFIMSRALNALLNLIFRQDAKDSKSGFVLGYKQVLESSVKHRGKYRYFQTFLGVAIRSKSLSVGEVETLFDERKSGVSFLSGFKSIRATFGTLLDLPIALKEYSRRTFREIPGIEGLPTYSIRLSAHRRILFEVYFLLFPLHTWLISRKVKSYYKILKSTEFSSRNQLREIQLLRLRNLLIHAYRTVPYYRELFQSSDINPLKISNLEDLHQIPLLSKDDVRENIHFSLFSRSHKKGEMQRIQTSGSTGEPFVCYADKFQLEMRFATTLRALEMVGWQFGDKQTRLWHQKLGMTRGMALKEKLDALLLRRKFVSLMKKDVQASYEASWQI